MRVGLRWDFNYQGEWNKSCFSFLKRIVYINFSQV